LKESIDDNCTNLFDALLNIGLLWEWDKRFNTTLAQVRLEEGKVIEGILENHLGRAWNSSTIDTAPKSVLLALNRLDGVMSNQLFYAADLPQEGIIFCAWWPLGETARLFPFASVQLLRNRPCSTRWHLPTKTETYYDKSSVQIFPAKLSLPVGISFGIEVSSCPTNRI